MLICLFLVCITTLVSFASSPLYTLIAWCGLALSLAVVKLSAHYIFGYYTSLAAAFNSMVLSLTFSALTSAIAFSFANDPRVSLPYFMAFSFVIAAYFFGFKKGLKANWQISTVVAVLSGISLLGLLIAFNFPFGLILGLLIFPFNGFGKHVVLF